MGWGLGWLMHRWIGLFLVVTATACGGSYPFDDSARESGEFAQEIAEGQRLVELDNQYREDLYDQYASEASTEMAIDALEDAFFSSDTGSGNGQAGCPNGCTYHPPGCDIKGNISFNTGEKIYHLPGQDFYNDTIISTENGERWFCTEIEAISNGWRKSKV